ncbi:MAG: tungsten ABC transporter substrate-binding protein [Anaerolinea sp.]|nr:tungsten ABC transporter substrate-binding protein [Anaerolinea sp.]
MSTKLFSRILTGGLAALSLSLLALPIAACGDDDDGPAAGATQPGAATAAASPTTTPEAKIGGSMILATTTSTQDSGLLDVLVPMFTKATGVEVKVIAVGTGAALEMAAKGDADAVLAHSPATEKKYVTQGDLSEGQLVMHNDYVIVGPASDPAGVKKAASLNAAMTAIAANGAFVSRGDNSGTHAKELELWKAAGVDPKTVKQREETGQGMGATLNVADQKQSYTLTDRATYLSLRKNLKLEVMFEKAGLLLNIYHVYVVSPARHANVKAAQARAFVAFMVSPEVQKVIGEFKVAEFGQQLFVPDAFKDEADLEKQ